MSTLNKEINKKNTKRLTSSVERTSERKSKGRGFESYVGLTLCLESKNLSTALNIIYIFIYTHKQI